MGEGAVLHLIGHGEGPVAGRPGGGPVGVGDNVGPAVVDELEAAALLGEEGGLGLLQRELLPRGVLIRLGLLVQHLLGQPVGLLLIVEEGGGALHGGPQLVLHCGEAVQQQGVKGAAFPVEDHGDGGLVGEGGLVAAVAGEGVVHIGQRHHLRGDGDLVPLQAIGIAAAVPPLVVPAADLVGGAHQRVVLRYGHVPQQLVADDGVALHDLKLFVGEFAGLVEDLVRDLDLADVVQGGEGADAGDVLLREGVAVRDGDQLLQHQAGDGAHM